MASGGRRRIGLLLGVALTALTVGGAGPAPYEGFVALGAAIPDIQSTGNKQLCGYKTIPFKDNATTFRLLFLNLRCTAGGPRELGSGAAGTMRAALEHPAGVFTTITFSTGGDPNVGDMPAVPTGNTTSGGATIAGAQNGSVWCDPVTPATPVVAGDEPKVHYVYTVSAGSIQYSTIRDTSIGADGKVKDLCRQQVGTTWDQTTVTADKAALGSAVSGSYGPWLVVGQTTRATWLLGGDSIMRGSDETAAPADDRKGIFARALRTTDAFVKMASDAAVANPTDASGQGFQQTCVARSEAFPFANNVVGNWGINDAPLGATAANIRDYNVSNLTWVHPVTGKTFAAFAKKWLMTLTPRATDSVDAWTTTANQTPTGSPTTRTQYNDLLRAGGISGITGFVEIARNVVEASPNDSGKWYVPPGTEVGSVADAAINTATNARVVTSATANFDAAKHTGTCIKIAGATGAGATLRSMIVSVDSATQVTIVDAATNTVSAAACTFGGISSDALHPTTKGNIIAGAAIDLTAMAYP